MKLNISLSLLISLLIVSNIFAQTTTTGSGNWNNGTIWSSGVPRSNETANVNHRLFLNTNLSIGPNGNYIINSEVRDNNGGGRYDVEIRSNGRLDINANIIIGGDFEISGGASFVVRSFDTLFVGGDADFSGGANITIEEDGVIIVDGDFEMSGGARSLINGKMFVNGDVEAGGGARITGSGNFQSNGETDFRGGSRIFGNNNDCPSGCEYGSGSGLPIELKSFEVNYHPANNQLVEVKWTTLSEINNERFILEHAVEGSNYEEVGQLKGAGNSNRELDYQLLVRLESSTSMNHYFRLKQVDFDGTSKTFKPVALKKSNASSNHQELLSVYPNPSNGQKLTIAFTNFQEGVYEYLVLDSKGQTLINNSVWIQNGSTNDTFDLLEGQQLSKGIYFVRIVNKGEQITKKVIVQ